MVSVDVKHHVYLLFIRTKHRVNFQGLSPLSSSKMPLEQQLNGWKMRWRVKPLFCFWLSYVVFMSSTWSVFGWTMLFLCPVPDLFLVELCCFYVKCCFWLSCWFYVQCSVFGWAVLCLCPMPYLYLVELCCVYVQCLVCFWLSYVVFMSSALSVFGWAVLVLCPVPYLFLVELCCFYVQCLICFWLNYAVFVSSALSVFGSAVLVLRPVLCFSLNYVVLCPVPYLFLVELGCFCVQCLICFWLN